MSAGRHLLYITGQPGAGKSTLVAGLTDGLRSELVERPFAHTLWAGAEPVVELGQRREAFSGTDTLSMSVNPLACQWMDETPYRLVLAEGDRLANGKFLESCERSGWRIVLLRLVVSQAVAEYRRQARAAELGVRVQDDSWVRSRVTKGRTLASAWMDSLREVDADGPAEGVLARVRALDHPVLAALGATVAA